MRAFTQSTASRRHTCPRVDRRIADAALVERLRSNDPSAAADLLSAYAGELYAVAGSILGEDQAANDAVQDGLLNALQSIGSLRDSGSLGAWLRRTVANCALAELRKRRRGRERSIDDLLPSFHDDGNRVITGSCWAGAADAMTDRDELIHLVRESMQQIPAHYREVLMLRDVVGMDTQETAVTLGITPNHAKVRLHRARQALRTLIEEQLVPT